MEIPILLNSEVPNISRTQRFRTSSPHYIYKNAEDKIPDEDNDDVDEKKSVIEDDNEKDPDETKLIKPKMKSKVPVIYDDGT